MPRKTLSALAAVVLFGSLLASAPVGAQTADGQTAGGQVAERDSLIAAQENLLNTYRCQHNIDTQLVAGGCSHTGVSQTAPNTGTEPGQPQISNADIPTQAQHLSVQLGDLRYNTADMVLRTFFDLYGCLTGGLCFWSIGIHRYTSILDNMIDVYGRSYPRDTWFSLLDQLEDALRTLDTLVNAFSEIADGYSTPGATVFAELKSQSSGLLNSLSEDIFNQIEDAVDQVEVLEVPKIALFSVRQAVDNARIRISEVLRLLDG